MRLNELISALNIQALDVADFEVKGLTSDSRKVKEDFIFVAIDGHKLDGNSFIQEALRRGARLVISQNIPQNTSLPKDISFLKVKDSRLALAQLAAQFYRYPSRKLKVIGVTGTNGKTTITYLMEHLLKCLGYSAGVIGTINYRFKDKSIAAKNTTPGPEDLQELLAQMHNADVRYALMEVSSHALDQRRVEGVDFHCAIFTNLTQDHLDYHQDMENYFQAKSLLFRSLNSNALAILNRDDAYSQRLINMTPARVLTYGLRQGADIWASDIKLASYITTFNINNAKIKTQLNSKLIGRHNIYNILAVFKFALEEGFPPDKIKQAIESFTFVPGRLENIDRGQPFKVFIDYAHTDDALYNVLSSLKDIPHKRIILVFGCGGERDKGKRPKMGAVATEMAEHVYITSDNPRSENPEEIIQDIVKGIKKHNYQIILDRRQAIFEAMQMAKEDDIVLIAGKGHETYQIFKDRIIEFSDREVAEECLGLMKF